MKRLIFLVTVAVALFAVLTTMPGTALAGGGPDPNTVNGLPRRACWPWMGQCSFNQGEAVVGVNIWISGTRYEFCFFRSAPAGGVVVDGAINYWPGDEVNPYLTGPCKQSPPPILPSGLQRFEVGDTASAFNGVVFADNGLIYANCWVRGFFGGYVSNGVVNQFIPAEMTNRFCGAPVGRWK